MKEISLFSLNGSSSGDVSIKNVCVHIEFKKVYSLWRKVLLIARDKCDFSSYYTESQYFHSIYYVSKSFDYCHIQYTHKEDERSSVNGP